MKRLIFLILASLPISSFAHDSGEIELGDGVSATDLIMVTCSPDGSISADKLYFQLSSDTPSTTTFVSAQIAKGNLVTTVTDVVNGDGKLSREAEVNGGAGTYRVTINKNGLGEMNYSFEYHCESNGGLHSETKDFVMIQDQ